MEMSAVREYLAAGILIGVGVVALLIVLGQWLRIRWTINVLRNYLDARRRSRRRERRDGSEDDTEKSN
jgi:hypothetical protein